MPYEGGLYNQPYGHILRMEAVLDMTIRKQEADERRMQARQKLEQMAKQATPAPVDLAED